MVDLFPNENSFLILDHIFFLMHVATLHRLIFQHLTQYQYRFFRIKNLSFLVVILAPSLTFLTTPLRPSLLSAFSTVFAPLAPLAPLALPHPPLLSARIQSMPPPAALLVFLLSDNRPTPNHDTVLLSLLPYI